MAYLTDYSPKQRFRITLAGLAILAIAAFYLSIRPTLQLRSTLKERQAQAASLENAPQEIAQLRSRLDQMEQSAVQGQYDRNELFSLVSTFCDQHDLRLQEFGLEHQASSGQVTFITNPITVSGDFQDILRLIYYIEQEARLGFVVNTDFTLQRKLRSRTEELTALIYLQHLAFASSAS